MGRTPRPEGFFVLRGGLPRRIVNVPIAFPPPGTKKIQWTGGCDGGCCRARAWIAHHHGAGDGGGGGTDGAIFSKKRLNR